MREQHNELKHIGEQLSRATMELHKVEELKDKENSKMQLRINLNDKMLTVSGVIYID